MQVYANDQFANLTLYELYPWFYEKLECLQ